MEWYDFSIIRYAPNLKRGEVINIGLILNGPNGLEIRLIDNYSKVRMIDGLSNAGTLSKLQKNLEEMVLSDSDNAIKIINKSIMGIEVSSPSTFQLGRHETYIQKVNQLYVDLVKPYPMVEPKARVNTCRLMSDIKRKLNRQLLLSTSPDDLYKNKIISSYVINDKSGITADLILKDESFHMSSVVDFNVSDVSSKFKETGLKVLSFLEAEKSLSTDMKKYFVYSADAKKENQISGHLSLVESNCHEMFNMNSSTDSSRYYELMVELTHQDTLGAFH